MVPALISCASSAGRAGGDYPPFTADSLIMSDASGQRIALDSVRVDSLQRDGVFLELVVDERPKLVFGPQLNYPEEARRQCITGRVIVQAIVGRSGRAEAVSVRIFQHVDPELDRAALEYVRQASYKPGKVHGEPVRTLVKQPIDFKISGRRC